MREIYSLKHGLRSCFALNKTWVKTCSTSMFDNILLYATKVGMTWNLTCTKFDASTFTLKKNRWISTDDERDTLPQTWTHVVISHQLRKWNCISLKLSRVPLSGVKQRTKITPIELKFYMHIIGNFDFQTKEEVTNFNWMWTSYDFTNMDSRHFRMKLNSLNKS